MTDPRSRPPAASPPVSDTVTGEWPSGTHGDPAPAPAPDGVTVTASGQSAAGPALDLPNPFGRYAIKRLLGRGGMAAVFLAHDPQMDRPVALKIPNFSGTLTDAQKQRFFREARSIAALRHPNICPVYDADEEQGVLYLTMHYIDGQPLSALIDHGPMAAEKAIALVRRLAEAMQVAHTHGTIHRDLKPANIMIDRAGEPVVMDFGLARRTHWVLEESRHPGAATPARDQGLTQHGSVLGTPAYMPPEQSRGDVAAIGPRSDIYSLGVILYELLTGRRPFAAEDTAELIRQIENDPPPRPTDFYPWIAKGIEAACLKALAKDPADRFATMGEFERALKEVVEPELKVVVPPPLPKPARKKRRWVKPVGCLAVSLLLLTVCVGGPAAAVWWVVNIVMDKAKDITDSQAQADAEWNAIINLWPSPAADAKPETLLPPTFDNGRFRLRTDDPAPPDSELGIALTGRRGIYSGPEGDVEVRFYRCQEAEAKAIQQKVHAFTQARMGNKVVAGPGSKREKAIYSGQDTGRRTVTFGFHDESWQTQEYGKLWYGGGWLYWFRTTQPLVIEWFPSKFLLEVGRRTSGAPESKWK